MQLSKQLLIFSLISIAIFTTFQLYQYNSSGQEQNNKNLQQVGAPPKIDYPVRFVYIDQISHWTTPQKIAAGMGVPGYATPTIYNYIALAFWTHKKPDDIVQIWSNPIKYFGTTNPFGKTKDEIQKALKKKYNDAGIRIMISAFGATQFPTTAGYDPLQCATKLGTFVQQNNLDGVDIDYEDDKALQAGKGQQWLISFQTKLRQLLPNHIITHAPIAPYFKKQYYKNGAYITLDQKVGHTINFYNVQFYNQDNTKYDTYPTLFINSTGEFKGTAVQQIIYRGIQPKKIIVGKPATPKDADNTGWMDTVILGAAIDKGYDDLKWYGGVMFWQYISDLNGSFINNAAKGLKQRCQQSKNCN